MVLESDDKFHLQSEVVSAYGEYTLDLRPVLGEKVHLVCKSTKVHTAARWIG